MLDFLAFAWDWMVPAWGASWWWMAIVGAVVGIILDVVIEEDNPVILAIFGAAVLGCWPLVLMVGIPIVLGSIVWVLAWWVKAHWQSRGFTKQDTPEPEEPDSMTVESPDLYHKDDLK